MDEVQDPTFPPANEPGMTLDWVVLAADEKIHGFVALKKTPEGWVRIDPATISRGEAVSQVVIDEARDQAFLPRRERRRLKQEAARWPVDGGVPPDRTKFPFAATINGHDVVVWPDWIEWPNDGERGA